MPTCGVVLIASVLSAVPHAADSPRPIEEFHEAALLDGARVGTMHTAVTPDGKLLRTTATLDLTLRRYGSLVRLRKEHGTVETSAGKVVGVFLRQGAPGGKQLVLDGVVDGDKLHVKVDAGRLERRLDWPADVVSLRQQDRLFVSRKPRPGDRFQFVRYEPTYNAVLTVRVAVKDRETVDVLGVKRSLLRVELTPDRLEAAGQSVRPAGSVWWLNDDFVPVRRQTDLEGLGTLTLTRTTREKATATAAVTADIGARSLVPLDRVIPRPYDTRSVQYRITVRDEEDAARLFVSDDHQEVRNARGDTFELIVHPVRGGGRGDGKPAEEYLASCHYIDHEDRRVVALTMRACGDETDPWRKAQRIERWVKNAMVNDNRAELAPASVTAWSLKGDCRHHALLTAAMCRSAGIGSRTAIGLLYVQRGGAPKLGFHMWAEVYVGGKWVGLDSTLGKGGVSGTHVKITENSWHKVESLTPLLPVSRVMGKLRVEVVKSE